MNKLIDELAEKKTLSYEKMFTLLSNLNDESREYLHEKARVVTNQNFHQKIYIRGLIEISNYCKNNCYYCGIRNENQHIQRYRLKKDEIMECCKDGYELGFRTFVLQSGEDLYYTDEIMCEIIQSIKGEYPDCAITLSLGEKDRHSYEKYKEAGADRYLLRHETIMKEHYQKLHPVEMQLDKRVECLHNLKELGFQVGSGIMVGSPFQSIDMIIHDLYFLEKLKPEMIGIGPYIPHQDTPFHYYKQGSLDLTLTLISILRLMHPYALIPSTTALSTIHEFGREKGILAGANVVMPNLSPMHHRKDYSLYDNKAYSDAEAKEGLAILKERMQHIGYEIICDRGDYKSKEKQNV